jgi:hypothetical protein
MYHWTNLLAFYVMGHERRAQQIRPARSRRIRAMTKAARLFELLAPALRNRGPVRVSLLLGRRTL